MRYRWLGIIVAAAALLTTSTATAVGTTAASTQRVIVVLKNQDSAQPASRARVGARRAALRSTQSPVLSQLSASGAANVHSYTVLNAVSATVSPAEDTALKSDPAVKEVVPDQIIHLPSPVTTGTSSASSGATPVPGACARNGQVQLNPESLQTMSVDSDDPHALTARSLGITGAGVKVAFIADGLDVDNPDFIRPDGQHVFVDYKDFSGLGTGTPTGGGEGFLDASAIAAQGRTTYDVSHYSDLPLNQPCRIRVEGVAPGASLVGLDIFGDENEGFNSSLLEAIDYAVSVDHVNVLNESLGINNYPDDQASLDLVKQANDAAVAAGTTVTVATGDAGITNTEGTPATDPNVIAAGAATSFRAYMQDGYGGARFPGVRGWLDDNVSSLSSSGFQQDGQTIDLLTGGESNWALCSTDVTTYADCSNLAGQPTPVQDTGGTSQSAPLAAGLAALVIQAYEKTHGGDAPSPALVKALLTSNTDDIGSPADQQGSGRADAYKAVLAAEALGNVPSPPSPPGARGHHPRRGHGRHGIRRAADVRGADVGGGPTTQLPGLLDSATQLNAIAAPGSAESLSDTITNASDQPETLGLSTRALGAYTPLKTATVTLSDATSLHFTDWQGVRNNYGTVTFQVPPGVDRLNASIAYQGASLTDPDARVREFLIDPRGRYAGDSRPQGVGNYGDYQVTDPAPGTWTAVIHSRDSADGGTTGPVLFGASAARYTSFGTVSPDHLRLAPGQAQTVDLQTSTPSTPGDASGAIVIRAGDQGWSGAPASDSATPVYGPSSTTTIPVTLRSLIPVGEQTFTGTLTGGNGRDPISGQEDYYQLNVPAGDPELNTTVTLDGSSQNPFGIYLIDPAGQAVGYGTNMVPSAGDPTTPNTLGGAQAHALAPAAGTWTVIVVFAPQDSGTALATPFTVTTDESAVPAGGGGLPNSAATALAAGHASTYAVTVKNTGTAAESFFPDARLPGSTVLSLGALTGATTTEPLTFSANLPTYLVPTDSTTLSSQATTTGPQAIAFDSQPTSGDPDIVSTAGTTATAVFSAAPVTAGEWDVAPTEVGPFGSNPGPSESVSTSASATTSPFDPTVTAPTGDLEADSADPATSLPDFSPVTVGPGQTATIPVTITPAGRSGTVVSGTLYLDDVAEFEFGSIQDDVANVPFSEQVAAIPYRYTVK